MTRFELADAERVDEVRDLWVALCHHHRAVVGDSLLVDDELARWSIED